MAERGTIPPRYLGSLPNTPRAVRMVVRRLAKPEQLLACYEAGATGYGLCRLPSQIGVRCIVVAPSLIAVRLGDQVKTDRRNALRLAQLLRASEEDGALREFVRAGACQAQSQASP